MDTLGTWREALRSDNQHRARWRTLLRATEWVAEPGPAERAAAAVLGLAAREVGAQDGCVLLRVGDAVRVWCGIGGARPAGALVPGARGWPSLADPGIGARHPVRDTGLGWCLVPAPEPLTEWHLPIRCGGRVLGVMVLRPERRDVLPDDDLDLLQALAVLLAARCPQAASSATRARRPAATEQRLHRLTPRERQVLALLPRGYANAELGAALGISPATVKTHVERILRKLQCKDRTHAAVWASQHGVAV